MLSTCMIYQFGRGNLSCHWKGSPGHRLCWHGVKREVNDAEGRKPKAVIASPDPCSATSSRMVEASREGFL